jgi:Protein of unknown function (DUF5132)
MGQATTFLLGFAAAWLLPVVTRAFRPLAVEMAAAGLGMLEEARRVMAEQIETLEDIAAEARARRDELGSETGSDEEADAAGDTAGPSRARKRSSRRR